MAKQTEYQKELQKQEERIEKKYSEIINDVFANFYEDSHKMLVGEEILKVYNNPILKEEISLLEKVELWDLWNYDRK